MSIALRQSQMDIFDFISLFSGQKPQGYFTRRILTAGRDPGATSLYLFPLFPSPRMIPDRSSPSRVRFAASRPGLLAGRSEGDGCLRGKRGGWAGLAGPKGTFRPYQCLKPQRWGGVTRRAVAERRRRVAA